jgi:hypothetical protein
MTFVLVTGGEAHKGITSKFTYNAEVHAIFLARCGRCHVDGGVGPMSLLKYEDAFPWAESLRTELLGAESTEAADFISAAHRNLSARELDVILDWATGGTPEGDKANTPAPVTLQNDWARGEPSLALRLPMPFQLAADKMETTEEFVLPVAIDRLREVTAIDVLPGNPSIVRQATISLRANNGSAKTLGTWTPLQTPAPVAVKPPVRLAAGSELVARIHYKKTWKFEGQPMSDQSTIGLYFE